MGKKSCKENNLTVLHFCSSQDLNSLLMEYCEIHNDRLENILFKISKFAIIPSWKISKFVCRGTAELYVPQYVKERTDVLLNKDDYSKDMLNIANIYYDELSESNPKIYEFSNALIKLIMLAGLESYREGTTADGLSIAHIDFKRHYNKQDFNELIVHQITHFLLYYNDAINLQMHNEYKKLSIKTDFQHKRGGQEFPLYIMFHSFCVAIEVLQFRIKNNILDCTVNYHSTSANIIKRCNICISALIKNRKYFTAHGQELLDKYIYSFKKQENLIC